MSLETNIILSLIAVQMWLTPYSRIKEPPQNSKPVRHLKKYVSVNKRKLYKFKQKNRENQIHSFYF
ncbi:hypothetical protein BK744_20525 [Bacillus thuringiensis serovar zhaodongensis]|nr:MULTISPECIES: hypothetical protein [Bacillus cereus group]MCU5601401.1 hypothetical protein [Bacillus wiedmannii]OUB72078.1 hypothetical protein BK744_20525 [Bacillus thuringiensis serovar zhaodongensis]